jgi:hypothetical protein
MSSFSQRTRSPFDGYDITSEDLGSEVEKTAA